MTIVMTNKVTLEYITNNNDAPFYTIEVADGNLLAEMFVYALGARSGYMCLYDDTPDPVFYADIFNTAKSLSVETFWGVHHPNSEIIRLVEDLALSVDESLNSSYFSGSFTLNHSTWEFTLCYENQKNSMYVSRTSF